MKHPVLLTVLALAGASCTSPMAPTPLVPAEVPVASEGGASTRAVTADRLRLRRVGGPDIATGLVSGQVIDVPLNAKLDIWAEIQRLETDRARVSVDWGNGNRDLDGCGSCRVENTYTQPGRYTVRAEVTDMNAPAGASPILAVTVTLIAAPAAEPSATPCAATATSFVGNLNGTSPASTFETGGITSLPSLGWSNVSGAGRVWDGGVNGVIINLSSPWGNYQVQHDTGVAVLPSTTYELNLDMGYVAGWTNGNSGFSMQLGTVTGGVFTGLGAPVTGFAPFAGYFPAGVRSATARQVFTTGPGVSGGTMALRWQQTSAIAVNGFSDWLGIDNVTLAATRCVP